MSQRQPAEEGSVGEVGAGFEVLAVGDGLAQRTHHPRDSLAAAGVGHAVGLAADPRLQQLSECIEARAGREFGWKPEGQAGVDQSDAGHHVRAPQTDLQRVLG